MATSAVGPDAVLEERPVVSVCIPTVDRLGYLREAVASVAAQSLESLEIVIADNSANPAYQRNVRDLIAEFTTIRIRLHQHAARLSMVDNTNFLVDAADGQHWIYLPDDDRLRPDCLARLVETLAAEPQAAFAWCDHWIVNASGRIDEAATAASTIRWGRDRLSQRLYRAPDLLAIALRQSFSIQCMLFRREVIREFRFDPAFGPVLDFDLELRLGSSRAVNAAYRAERLVEYRVHDRQISTTATRRANLQLMVGTLARCAPASAHEWRTRDHLVARCYRGLAAEAFRAGQYGRSMVYAARAISYALFGLAGSTFGRKVSWVRRGARHPSPPSTTDVAPS